MTAFSYGPGLGKDDADAAAAAMLSSCAIDGGGGDSALASGGGGGGDALELLGAFVSAPTGGRGGGVAGLASHCALLFHDDNRF